MKRILAILLLILCLLTAGCGFFRTEYCFQCGKQITVTPFSKAETDGVILCPECRKAKNGS